MTTALTIKGVTFGVEDQKARETEKKKNSLISRTNARFQGTTARRRARQRVATSSPQAASAIRTSAAALNINAQTVDAQKYKNDQTKTQKKNTLSHTQHRQVDVNDFVHTSHQARIDSRIVPAAQKLS